MNKYIKQRRAIRKAAIAKIVSASAVEALDRVVGMSEAERTKLVSDFVQANGIRGALNKIKNIISSIVKSNRKAAMYEGFNERDREEGEHVVPSDSKLKGFLQAGDWEFLLTFLVMLALVHENYPFEYDPVTGQPDWLGELKAFFLASFGVFIAWVGKKLYSILKNGKF